MELIDGKRFSVERNEDMNSAVCDDTVHDNDEMCGCEVGCGQIKSKRCTFSIFNSCNNAKVALLFLSLAALLQGLVTNGFFNIVVSTLEKRFMLRSSETGFVSSSYDIAGCLSIPLITYVGGRGHKPMWIGNGLLIMGLGSVIFSIPHFIAPVYSITETESYTCGNSTSGDCEGSLRLYRAFFIVSQLLQGIGATPLYTLGIAYLDENVRQIHSSIFHGIFYAFSLFGPGIGYLFGGYLLTHYTNLSETLELEQDSPLWVGNWWLGFLIVGILQIILAFPLMMFPRQLPGTEDARKDRGNEMQEYEEAKNVAKDENFGRSIRDLPRCLLILLKNPTLVFISFAAAMDSGLIIGIATFGPKYIESMFSISASSAAFYFGTLAIATASSGHLISGLLVSKLKLSVKQMIRMCLVCSVLAFGAYFIFLQRCENANIVGVIVPYSEGSDMSCVRTSCGCSVPFYNPICGADNLTYLSYCDAGCEQINATHFTNCSRIPSPSTASLGTCENNTCSNFGIVLFVLSIAVFFTFMKGQPALQASLRSVPFHQRSFALGIQWLIIRILGSIPMPIVFGKVLDLSCLIWDEECGECGSCQVYDNQTMSRSMTIVSIVLKGTCTVCLLVVLNTYRSAKQEDDEEELLEDSPVTSVKKEPLSLVENKDSPSSSSKGTVTFDNEAFSA